MTRMSRDEEIRLIKSFSLEEYLLRFYGLRVAWRSERLVCCYSPFRDERRPSFYIYRRTNSWFDFGLGKGGTVIDFEAEMRGSLAEAMAVLRERILSRARQDPSLIRRVEMGQKQEQKPFELDKEGVLGWNGTRWVLKRHGFSDPDRFEDLYHHGRIMCTSQGELICPMVQVVQMRLRLCGVAVRRLDGSKRIKGEKGISLWERGFRGARLAVFEGVRDALAFLAGVDRELDVVLLHGQPSEEQLRALKHVVSTRGYMDILICTDADPAGEALASKVRDALRGLDVNMWDYPPPEARDWYEYVYLQGRWVVVLPLRRS